MQKAKTGKPYNHPARSKNASQNRKRNAGGSVECTRFQRREMESMLKWMVANRRGGYRFIAKHTIGPARFGWLQRVATGKRDVRPTKDDFDKVRRLYDLLQDEHDISTERLEKLLRLTEIFAEANQIMVWCMRQE